MQDVEQYFDLEADPSDTLYVNLHEVRPAVANKILRGAIGVTPLTSGRRAYMPSPRPGP